MQTIFGVTLFLVHYFSCAVRLSTKIRLEKYQIDTGVKRQNFRLAEIFRKFAWRDKGGHGAEGV